MNYKAVGIERLHYFTQDIGRLPELFCLAVKCFVIARREPDVQKFGERFGCHINKFWCVEQSVPQLIYNVQQIQNLFLKVMKMKILERIMGILNIRGVIVIKM